MDLTPQHEELRRTIRRFIAEEVNPHCAAWEEATIFPAHELFKKMGDLGLLGINKPEAFGGLGLDYSYAAVAAEEFARINSGGVAMAIGVQTDMATPALARFGSDDLRAQFLAPSIAGDKVACIGVSEPHAGSDVAAIRTRAVEDGDDLVINGSKMWITNGTQADWMCMLANTSDGNKHQNKSLICVPLKDQNGKRAKGVTVARKLKKMGMHSSDTAELFFDDVRVPKRNIIGEPGMGFVYQMLQFQEERLYGALSSITGCELTIEETIDYTRNRKAFGKALIENQVVHYRLIELMTEVEALRALTWKGVGIHVAGGDCTVLASMAKLKAARLTREVNDSCLQFWGGMGFMDETMVSRRYRDGRLTSIGGGADEVMIGIIAKFKGLLPGKN
ncbi:acyl-CoA dehydrogenase family protein [Zavarzinia compransoris]|uniref:Acyl-CoA dehydrogenase n=1 Tax=Zavarzinia compransoris TaxID=1264899 RepID=A0A317E9Q4_9PROT|nr:acyl-CoA dehydrogenase family protein [Zavarzinia compransoris]PWR23649.1 acyl-CoA dehydrogenase [Zavarzinia compransoris]TDP47867.1 citronellyl-CoA dehydrogenase [Zavarzinia compransoris]